MPDDDAKVIPEATPALSAQRGYGAEFREIWRSAFSLWWLLLPLLLFFTVTVGSNLFTYRFKYSIDHSLWALLYDNFSLLGLICLGSVMDWLGLRRSMLYLYLGSLFCLGSIYIVWLSFGNDLPNIAWMIFFAVDTTIATLIVLARNRGIRRYTSLETRMAVIGLYWVLHDIFGTMSGSISEAVTTLLHRIGIGDGDGPITRDLFSPHALPAFLLLLAIGYLVIRKKFPEREKQTGHEAGNDIGKVHPSGPFSGWKDIPFHSPFRKAVLLSFLLFLFNHGFDGVRILYRPYEQFQFWGIHLQVGIGVVNMMYILSIAFLLLLPIIVRKPIGNIILACAVLAVFSISLATLPLTGSVQSLCSLVQIFLYKLAMYLFVICLIVYVINASPVGREGSMLAGLAVFNMLFALLKFVWSTWLEGQVYAPWTEALVGAIHPGASAAHALWMVVLVPVLLGTVLLFVFRKYLFGEESTA